MPKLFWTTMTFLLNFPGKWSGLKNKEKKKKILLNMIFLPIFFITFSKSKIKIKFCFLPNFNSLKQIPSFFFLDSFSGKFFHSKEEKNEKLWQKYFHSLFKLLNLRPNYCNKYLSVKYYILSLYFDILFQYLRDISGRACLWPAIGRHNLDETDACRAGAYTRRRTNIILNLREESERKREECN